MNGLAMAYGDLWDFHPTHWIVVPVNCGWNKRGLAIMGTGVALDAAKRFPYLRKVWGQYCQEAAAATYRRDRVDVIAGCLVRFDTASRCILFPTKPLDVAKPSFSWRLPAALLLIEQSAGTLAALRGTPLRDGSRVDRVALPLVGCGAGGLQRHEVLPILRRELDDNFTLVEQPASSSSKIVKEWG